MYVPTVQKILHATDFSQHSVPAAQYASLLTRKFAAELHLLYVVEDSLGKIPDGGELFPPPGERIGVAPEVWPQLEAKIGVEQVGADRVLLATRLGVVSDQVVAYATECEMDMIVIGTHGRRGLAHALMGSVAEAIVRNSTCPVLTVRPTAEN